MTAGALEGLQILCAFCGPEIASSTSVHALVRLTSLYSLPSSRNLNHPQVDFRQLKAGRPPSLLPFDTLLLPYPVSPAWRHRIAEACSAKYTDASTAVAGPNHSIYEHDGGHSAHQQGTDASTDHGASVVQDDRGEPTKERLRRPDTETRGQRQQGLNIGFIGHDFAEHPTAHMMEGVFVWQKRLAETTCGKQRSEGALETGRGDRSRKSRANDVTDSRASTNCCT